MWNCDRLLLRLGPQDTIVLLLIVFILFGYKLPSLMRNFARL